MIKRLLLGIAVLITILGFVFHWNTNILLHVDVLLILFVLAIALAPFSFGCFNIGTIPFTIVFCLIIFTIFDLFFGIQDTFNILKEPISYCNEIITNSNGTIILNETMPC